MADGSSRRDWRDQGVNFFTMLHFEGLDSLEIPHLVFPLFQLGIPGLIHIKPRKVGVNKITNVRDGWFARFFKYAEDILRMVSNCVYTAPTEIVAYNTTIRRINLSCQVNTGGMVHRFPGQYCMAGLLQGIHDNIYAP